MRGRGQIAELTAIAEPDVGVIVNVGPAHLELLGSLEAIAAAKAELIAGLRPGASVVLPAGEPLLAPHLRSDLHDDHLRRGRRRARCASSATDGSVTIDHDGEEIVLWPSFTQRSQPAATCSPPSRPRGRSGMTPHGRLEVEFSAMRGQRVALPGGVVLIDDCYNANPMSMRAAIDDLAATAPARRVAVLGDMLELGAAGAAPAPRDRRARCRARRRAAASPSVRWPPRSARGFAAAGEVHAARRRGERGRELLPGCCATATRCS